MGCRRLAGVRTAALRETRGVTLLEITIAVAIFAVAIGVAAQILVSFYATMDLQHQRVIAADHCRGVFSQIRNIRDASPNTSENPSAFQEAVMAQFPDGEQPTAPYDLRDATVEIAYESTDASANPLVPTVTVNWVDLRGRAVSLGTTTAITDR